MKICDTYCVYPQSILSTRYLTAIRDLRAGELIFTESPTVWSPGQREDTCLVCLKSTRETRGDGGVQAPGLCGHCWWPVCSEACRQSPVHRLECRYLASCTATSGRSGWRKSLIRLITQVTTVRTSPSLSGIYWL